MEFWRHFTTVNKEVVSRLRKSSGATSSAQYDLFPAHLLSKRVSRRTSASRGPRPGNRPRHAAALHGNERRKAFQASVSAAVLAPHLRYGNGVRNRINDGALDGRRSQAPASDAREDQGALLLHRSHGQRMSRADELDRKTIDPQIREQLDRRKDTAVGLQCALIINIRTCEIQIPRQLVELESEGHGDVHSVGI